MRKPFFLQPNNSVLACPKCGQNTEFVAHSQQIQEDLCEVWIVCKCGHDPHGSGDRMEDVWGGLDAETVRAAVECWNLAIEGKVPA